MSVRFFLIVVLTSLGVVGGMVSLMTWSTDGGGGTAQAMSRAENDIQEALFRARDLAISTRIEHGVLFDTRRERIAVVEQNGNLVTNPYTGLGDELRFDGAQRPVADILSADFGATGSAAVFDAQGAPVAGGTLVLSSGRGTRILVFDAITGRLQAR